MEKQTKKKKNKKKLKVFRFHPVEVIKNNGKTIQIRHPAYIFLEENNLLIYITITHSKKVEGKILLKLRNNPNPIDKNDSYWVVDYKKGEKNSFGKRLKEWKLNPLDDHDIRENYEVAKNKSSKK